MITDDDKGRYDAARRAAGFTGRSDRVRLEITGPDRAKVLHNLTTNDVKRLAPGRGCEAFLTNGQGRTLALLSVHAEEDRLLVRADADTAEAILGHLGKYGLFEDAKTRDISAETSEWHLFGPLADEVATSIGLPLPDGDLGIAQGPRGRVIRESPTGLPGLTLFWPIGKGPGLDSLRRAVEARGGRAIVSGIFEAFLIEAGTPVFGRDLTPANLPQEVNRDARAISFVKGCYLGQETVARLDALGHVNKILVGAVAESEAVPPAGAAIEAEGKAVGTVTSSAFSPGWGRGVVMGYVKTAHAAAGSTLTARWEGGRAVMVVHPWPMTPPQS